MAVLNQKIKKEALYFIGFWLIGYLLIYLSFLTILDPLHALRNSFGFVAPIILPVVILELIFTYFFPKKKYHMLIILAIATIAGFGLLNFYTIKLLVNNPEAESNTVLSIIIFFLLFRGIKFFRTGVQQQLALTKAKELQMETNIKLKEAETSKIKAELDAIKSQINPHFLFNTLNSIYSLVINNTDHAGDAILKLSSLMRYMLEYSKNKEVLLSDEISFIEDYLSLEKIRLEDNCQIEFEVHNTMKNLKIPPLLFVPLVENCFKHGISANKENNQVMISLRAEAKSILFTATNNKMPKRMRASGHQSGNSLNNLTKRLCLLYPDRHTYKVSEKESAYIVELRIEI